MNFSRTVRGLVLWPLLLVLDLVDTLLDAVFVAAGRAARHKSLPPPDAVQSVEVDREASWVAYRSVQTPGARLFRIDGDDGKDEYENLYETIARRARAVPDAESMGEREIVAVEDEMQRDGKLLKKYRMRDHFTWMTYGRVMDRVDQLAAGLLSIGLKSNDNIVIYAETRAEWLICAMACFKIKVPIVTLYATLGVEALAFGINQTNASYMIASGESVLKLQKIIAKCDKLKNVVVISDKLTEKNVEMFRNNCAGRQVFTMEEVEEKGESCSSKEMVFEKPKLDDLAIIMYTSGSTGAPKGVMLSHRNLLTSIEVLVKRLDSRPLEDTYIGYLPLAHVLELGAELACMMFGIRIGYSSVLTLTDTSTGIKQGDMGDIRVLRPTLFFTVPLVLERIKKAAQEKLRKQSPLVRYLFETAYELKLAKVRQGRASPLLDALVFNKIKSLMGGRLQKIMVGGSILIADVQEFVQVCIAPAYQAYGLTETCAGGTTPLQNSTATGQVGCVVECCELRLVDWPEGNYRVSDRPNPRGEIWVTGDNVSLGYFNMPDKTREDFRLVDGVRFFATGDVGEMTEQGILKIIDRKKDIVKLQGGEYVSLGKVETSIKLMQMVDNCCVIAHPTKTYCVCLITPNIKHALEYLAAKTGVEYLSTTNEINNNKSEQEIVLDYIVNAFDGDEKVRGEFGKEVLAHCLKQGLERFEVPTRFKMVREVWLPDSGLVTDSLKLKRKEIEAFYAHDISKIYL